MTRHPAIRKSQACETPPSALRILRLLAQLHLGVQDETEPLEDSMFRSLDEEFVAMDPGVVEKNGILCFRLSDHFSE